MILLGFLTRYKKKKFFFKDLKINAMYTAQVATFLIEVLIKYEQK